MITYLALLKKRTEGEQLLKIIRKYAAIYTDEMWSYRLFQNVSDLEKFLDSEPVLDLVSWDVTIEGALATLETMRSQYQQAYLMIIADASVSPMSYLKPGIFPGALLLKPMEQQDVEQIVRDLFEVFTGKSNPGRTESFLIETREGTQYIPVGQIDYFEAKEKKVFVRTKSCEYGFYDVLEGLENRLPAEFVRCHRSYIVNMKRAKALILAKNVIQMVDNIEVPFSRSYKKILRGYMKHV